jgi:hypothetical protein
MRKLGLLVVVLVIALMLATFGAGWKWGHNGSPQAGWTWDDNAASYVWTNT